MHESNYFGHQMVFDASGGLRIGDTLYIADLHLGKDHTFRSLGVPVPIGSTTETLARLNRLVERSRPRTLVLLGDLFHDQLSATEEFPRLRDAMQSYSEIEVFLVRGNHDRFLASQAEEYGLTVVHEPFEHQGFMLCHRDLSGHSPMLCGHLHPMVTLADRSDSVRLKCFWIRNDGIVLPSFGDFTGGSSVRPAKGDQIVVLTGETTLLLPSQVTDPKPPFRR